MFLINVAEWCVEALVLALALFFFSVGLFVLLMVMSICKQTLERSAIIEKCKEYILKT